MSFVSFATLALVFGAGLLPAQAFADSIVINPCFPALGIPCLPGTGTAGLEIYAQTYILSGARIAFLAVAIAFFFYYAVRLILTSHDESVITETKSAYGYAVAGAAVVSLASIIAEAFTSPQATVDIIVEEPIRTGLTDYVIFFLRLVVSIAATGTIVFLGVRLIVLQGEEAEIEKQKKRFFNGLLGVAIVLLANVAVNAFAPGTGSVALAGEIAGITNFILTLLGAFALLGFIVAGLLLVLSTDESLKDRAKKAVFTTVIAMIVVLSSFIIVRFVIDLNA